jgi:hypothetical protein
MTSSTKYTADKEASSTKYIQLIWIKSSTKYTADKEQQLQRR